MKKGQQIGKGLGSFFSQELPQPTVNPEIYSKNDDLFPIMGNEITRPVIYSSLWSNLSGSLVKYFLKYSNNPTEATNGVLLNLTEVMAFVLSKKKPRGIASETHNHSGEGGEADPAFITLKGCLRTVHQTLLPQQLLLLDPNFEDEFSKLKDAFDWFISDYEMLKDRNRFFGNNLIVAIQSLREAPVKFKDDEIRQLIKESISHFESLGYEIFNGFQTIKPFFLQTIENNNLPYFESRNVKRNKKSDKSKTELRHLQDEIMNKKFETKKSKTSTKEISSSSHGDLPRGKK